MLRTAACAAAVAAAPAGAQAALIQTEFRVNEAASAELSSLLGETHTVMDLYASFDEADDILINMGNGQIQNPIGRSLFQSPSGGDTSADIDPAVFDDHPAAEFDSYVAIGSALGDESTTRVSPSFQWLDDGLVSGWFAIPFGDPLMFPGEAPDSPDPDTGLFDVFAGRFSIAGDYESVVGVQGFPLGNPMPDPTAALSGGLDFNWVDGQGQDLSVTTWYFAIMPAPGAASLFGLAALAAARRRR